MTMLVKRKVRKDLQMHKRLKSLMLSSTVFSIMISSGCPTFAQNQAAKQEQSTAAKSAQPEVDSGVAKQAGDQRRKILDDAVTALNSTKKALTLLGDNKVEEALAALEVAIGKLELILARDSKLALAPVDTAVVIHDLYADLPAIETTITKARELLDDGDVQEARPLVAGLASEAVYQTTNIPLATYPAAIKLAVQQIDRGKIDKAKITLETALSTLVITENVAPLPPLRAKILLDDAEKLAQKRNRSKEENKRLADQLAEVRKQVQLAEVLGYGKKDNFKPIYDQIKDIEDKTTGGKSGVGWFDKIKKQISDFF